LVIAELYQKTGTMKNLPKSIAYLILVSILALYSSCKKDQPKEEMPTEMIVTDTTTVDSTDTDTVFPGEGVNTDADDANGYRKRTGKLASKPTASASSKNQGQAAKATAKDKNGKSLDGYSAPDGTDAENNDGDQYTKNDQKRMPSGGTSIK
jgi:hypothetical protein